MSRSMVVLVLSTVLAMAGLVSEAGAYSKVVKGKPSRTQIGKFVLSATAIAAKKKPTTSKIGTTGQLDLTYGCIKRRKRIECDGYASRAKSAFGIKGWLSRCTGKLQVKYKRVGKKKRYRMSTSIPKLKKCYPGYYTNEVTMPSWVGKGSTEYPAYLAAATSVASDAIINLYGHAILSPLDVIRGGTTEELFKDPTVSFTGIFSKGGKTCIGYIDAIFGKDQITATKFQGC